MMELESESEILNQMQHLYERLKLLERESFQFKISLNFTFQTTLYTHQTHQMADNIMIDDNLTTSQAPSRTKTISLRTKIVIALVFGFGYFLYRLLYKKYAGDACNIDKYHELTYEANRKLYHGWDNAIIGIGQLLMDGWVLFLGTYWLWNVKNMRFPIAAGVFFLFRALLLNTQKFPFPEDIVWHNPGFFSFTVPYEHTRDFFYSGHTGTLTIISLEFWTLGKKPICAICIVSLMYMINMLTITRIHYSIDVIGAFIFAPFWYFFIQKHLVKVDYMFSSIFYLSRLVYRKCRRLNYYDYGSQVQFEAKTDGVHKEPIISLPISVKIDMNDQITNGNDFPYLNEEIEEQSKKNPSPK